MKYRIYTQLGHILQSVLPHCPALRLKAPWDFLTVRRDIRGPIADPLPLMSELRNNFEESYLLESGIVHKTFGQLRINPALCNPDGAMLAYRRYPDLEPFAIIGPRGLLPPRSMRAVTAAPKDAWHAFRIHHCETLIGAFDVRDAALLDANGLPATLVKYLLRAGYMVLRQLERTFRDAKSSTGPKPAAPPIGRGGYLAKPQYLSLLGWSPRTLSRQPPPQLRQLVYSLVSARRYLGLTLPNVAVWRLSESQLEHLRYLIKLRRRNLISQFLFESLDSLCDLERFASELTPAPAPSYLEANAELLRCLTSPPQNGSETNDPLNWDNVLGGGHADRLRAARLAYEQASERELIAPQLERALASNNPIARSLGVQLANTSRVLNALSPEVYAVLTRSLVSSTVNLQADKLIRSYLQLSKHQNCLLRDLKRIDRQEEDG